MAKTKDSLSKQMRNVNSVEMTMTFDDQWLEKKVEEIQGMQTEIEKRIEQLKQQQLMNLGAITILNGMRNELTKDGESSAS